MQPIDFFRDGSQSINVFCMIAAAFLVLLAGIFGFRERDYFQIEEADAAGQRGRESILRVEPQANSNYNSLQFSLRKTSGPLTMSFAYTYSHSLDNSSDKADSNFVDSFNLRKNYASSNFDHRHILTASWIYDLEEY